MREKKQLNKGFKMKTIKELKYLSTLMYKDKYKDLTTKELKQKVEMLRHAKTMNSFRETIKKLKQTNKRG